MYDQTLKNNENPDKSKVAQNKGSFMNSEIADSKILQRVDLSIVFGRKGGCKGTTATGRICWMTIFQKKGKINITEYLSYEMKRKEPIQIHQYKPYQDSRRFRQYGKGHVEENIEDIIGIAEISNWANMMRGVSVNIEHD